MMFTTKDTFDAVSKFVYDNQGRIPSPIFRVLQRGLTAIRNDVISQQRKRTSELPDQTYVNELGKQEALRNIAERGAKEVIEGIVIRLHNQGMGALQKSQDIDEWFAGHVAANQNRPEGKRDLDAS